MKPCRQQFFENQRFYSVKEAAAILGVTTHAVRNWIYQGHLTAHRVGPGAKSKISILGSNAATMITVAYEREC